MQRSTKPKPAPSGAANTIGKGGPARAARAAAQERVAANAAAVDRLNDAAKPAYRAGLARGQFRALQAWEKGGRKGERPETPDYDAVLEQSAQGGAQTARAGRKRSGAPRIRSERTAAVAAALAAASGVPPERRRITDDELMAHIAAVRAAYPESGCRAELMHARWVEAFSVSLPRWQAAWDGTLTAKPAKAKPEAKTQPAKKATATAPGKRQVTPRPKATTAAKAVKGPAKRTPAKRAARTRKAA